MDLFRRLFGKSEEELNALELEAATNPRPTGKLNMSDNNQPFNDPSIQNENDEPTSDFTEEENLDTLETTESPAAEAAPQPTEEQPVRRSKATTQLPNLEDILTRPLAPEKVISNNNSHLTFGQSSDIGLVRTNNQDSALSFFVTNHSVEEHTDFGLFIVADGMGGHHDGEKASAITTRVIATYLNEKVYLPRLKQVNDPDAPTITESLSDAVQRANAEVMLTVPEGGTTVTAVAVIGDLAHFAHVGDSRAYLVTHDGAEQITRDHSLVQRLIELDQLTPDEAEIHPQKNVLYRAIGQSETLEIDILTRRLPPDSRVLLCSDGLWSQVHNDEIMALVMENPPQEACDKLVALANTRGGTDNITAIVLKAPR